MRQEMANVRDQMERLPNGGTQSDNPNGIARSLLNPKDCMPQVLGANYKTFWRTWSYKSRDWLGQMDRTLKAKLEKVESETKELSQSYLEDLNLSPQIDDGICRYLVHRLEGDPAEVVKTVSTKPGVEQFRTRPMPHRRFRLCRR